MPERSDGAGADGPEGPTDSGGRAARRTLRGRGLAGGAVLFLVVGLVLAVLPLPVNDLSPGDYVAKSYPRSPADDIGGDAVAYTSPLPPTDVAATITKFWLPGRGCADAEGVYLRYAEDTVVIRRGRQGSLILVEKSATAYPRYVKHVAGYWDR
ncbi:DUF4247 domain-containing protein [Couchioplanes caeruleus]|uniref:DUF4247 domain-containing protein n=1 Tax=Couchioplanes caeruleus TaxID=56438 RepID=UPI0014750AB2|nr:DUF4247 domain-containing protein [Couchioplanes caeruleus]